jgi:hypothetical protein
MKTAIAPMLSVRRGAEAIDFYKAAFGAAEMLRLDVPDGTVVARLAVEGAEFWVADESPSTSTSAPSLWVEGRCGLSWSWKIRMRFSSGRSRSAISMGGDWGEWSIRSGIIGRLGNRWMLVRKARTIYAADTDRLKPVPPEHG